MREFAMTEDLAALDQLVHEILQETEKQIALASQ